MLNDGVYGTSIFPPLLCKKVVVPTASVLQLFTTPYTLITGQAGKVIVPDKAFITKQTGVAYTINGATLNMSWAGTTVWGSWIAASLAGFANVATQSSLLVKRPLFSGAGSMIVQSSVISGQSLTMHNLVANWTVGTGDLNCWLTFRVWETNQLGWL